MGRSGFFFFSSFSFTFFFILPSIVDYLDPGYNGTSYGNLCSCTGTLSARMHFSRIKFIFVAMFTRRHVGMEKKKEEAGNDKSAIKREDSDRWHNCSEN